MVCARHIEESARRDLDFVDSMDQRVRVPMHQYCSSEPSRRYIWVTRGSLVGQTADTRWTSANGPRLTSSWSSSAGQPIEQPRDRSLADQSKRRRTPAGSGHRRRFRGAVTAAQDLTRVGRRYAKARSASEALRVELADVTRSAVAAGTSESEAARLAGVDRMTVRKWTGKR